MKKKYLFGMLFSGALLAACTADDLGTAPVAQEVNPTAPVFNVSIEDEGDPTRATYVTNGNKLSWTEEDLMSLFHGAKEELTNAQNAVYYGVEDKNTPGKFDFKTAAMVQPGYAVMVYPADVTFKNAMSTNNTLTSTPLIYVSAEQDASTKDSTVYISEVLNLSIDGKTTNTGKAGYGKNYDIVLKRAVGTLCMNLSKTNVPTIPEVDPIEITSVELTSVSASFATKGSISSTVTSNYSQTYPYWQGISKVTGLQDGAVNKVTSIDLDENQTKVFFTLLPTVTSNELNNSTVVVNTTYGVVTVADADAIYDQTTDANSFWGNNALKEKDVTNGLDYLINTALFAQNGSNAPFKQSWYGQATSPTIKVDLSKAKQDGMHIKKSSALKTAIKIFNYMSSHGGEKNITLYLDGDDNNRFTIEDNETWELMVEQMNKESDKITFVACKETEHKACTTVCLTNENETVAKEVPSINFSEEGNEEGNKVVVELAGLWTYDGKTTAKTYSNVKSLNVVKGATLTAKNEIVAEGNVSLENYGNVVISGTVDAKMGITNWNNITIDEDAVLGVTDGKCLTNKAAQATADHGVGVDGWSEGAVIDNYGWLAVKGNNEESAIYNFGVINSYEGARTLITKNARDNSDLTKVFKGGTNAFGTINIFVAEKKADNNVKIDADEKGFIILKLKKDNPTTNDIGDVANFVEIGGACANLTAENMPEQVKYIKITSSKEVKFNGEFEIDGLYLKPEGATVKANIPEGASVTVNKEFYLKGLLSVAGTLRKGSSVFNGYHGGSKNDENDYIYRAGGEFE